MTVQTMKEELMGRSSVRQTSEVMAEAAKLLEGVMSLQEVVLWSGDSMLAAGQMWPWIAVVESSREME